jgi:hypothetical protein
MMAEWRRACEAALAQAKAELAARVRAIALGGGMLAFAGAVATAAALVLTAMAVLGLSSRMPDWLAALVVALAALGTAALVALAGVRALRNVATAPAQAPRRAKEDVRWLRRTVRTAARS